MSGAYRVDYSRDAADDLLNIKGYVEQVSGSPRTARRQVNAIREAVRRLEAMPARHPKIEGGAMERRRARRLSVGSFAIFYVVDEERRRVSIVRIVGGRRDLRGIVGYER